MTSPIALDRVAEFETVLLDWFEQARPGVPVLTVLEPKDIRARACISCGIAIESGRWRCDECRLAIEHVLREFGQ